MRHYKPSSSSPSSKRSIRSLFGTVACSPSGLPVSSMIALIKLGTDQRRRRSISVSFTAHASVPAVRFPHLLGAARATPKLTTEIKKPAKAIPANAPLRQKNMVPENSLLRRGNRRINRPRPPRPKDVLLIRATAELGQVRFRFIFGCNRVEY